MDLAQEMSRLRCRADRWRRAGSIMAAVIFLVLVAGAAWNWAQRRIEHLAFLRAGRPRRAGRRAEQRGAVTPEAR